MQIVNNFWGCKPNNLGPAALKVPFVGSADVASEYLRCYEGRCNCTVDTCLFNHSREHVSLRSKGVQNKSGNMLRLKEIKTLITQDRGVWGYIFPNKKNLY